jgi:hypothetical protein
MKLRCFLTFLARRGWETGDYVVGEVTFLPNKLSRIELTSERMVEVVERDLIVRTSMSAGKTTSAKVLVRLLRGEGLTVAGAKLTGALVGHPLRAGCWGAAHLRFLVEVGLPSTVVPEKEYRKVLRRLLSRIATADAVELVAEVGSSPLNPYNGVAMIEEIGPNVRRTVLAASNPYAVTDVTSAFGNRRSADGLDRVDI